LGPRLFLAFAVLVLLSLLSYRLILRAAGEALVESHPPEKADAVLVLGGDWRGERVKLGGQLVAQGYAPIALVSGAVSIYGVNEADLAIAFAVDHGVPKNYFEPLYLRALSTRGEANVFRPELQKRKIKKLLLVTSNYHTRRAAALFRSTYGDSLEVIPVAAPDEYFTPTGWWHNREGQKTIFFEYCKVVASWLGM
jgi:uncharacterized SAM-binding protein YcdF (DUF218 family)